ncbi:hypothetical protein [Teredinibacter sp. KSP-S5-2]|uniref:hypothetical protein n=1 Tax=Teredinibacter sp. KSP-S5-2 TaxID=3034506 RepID=UPI00293468C4|nr:hypothetical protein [Teredinibacter sp. KSP-S5-2]WNO07830.1 hypothetical protein P5V12_12605 [Teredinibacter sp. KSP-S5-2]
MKLLAIALILILSSCATVSGDKKIIGYWKDGVCKNEMDHLYVTRFIDSDDKLKEILDEEAFNKEHADGLYRKLVETKLSQGGRYVEISATRKAWQSLYGAWGFGVVKNHCIVEFSPFIVS